MDNSGLVSIIVPVYQAEKYIKRCIDSVIKQSYENWELILINDGSTDSSYSICKSYEKYDSRIRCFSHENSGVSQTRNFGLDEAHGQYIFFLDSDDFIDNNCIEIMLQTVKRNSSDICFCGYRRITTSGNTDESPKPAECLICDDFNNNFFWNLYRQHIIFNIGTKMYRNEIINSNRIRFDTSRKIYEDVSFCLEYLQHCQKVSICSEPLYSYCENSNNSITGTYQIKFSDDSYQYCNELLENFGTDGINIELAILECLYRAFLQETYCNNKGKAFWGNKIKKMYSVMKKCTNNSIISTKISTDEFLFYRLLIGKHFFLLKIVFDILQKRHTLMNR